MSMGVRASANLFRKQLASVLHAKMSWYDQTPTGRILQRFSQDMRVLDSELTDSAAFFMFTSLFVLTSLGMVIGVTPCVPRTLGCYLFRVLFSLSKCISICQTNWIDRDLTRDLTRVCSFLKNAGRGGIRSCI